jgi:hypothetical protein
LVPDRMRPYIDLANLCPKVGSLGPDGGFSLRICSTLLRVNPPSFARVSKA